MTVAAMAAVVGVNYAGLAVIALVAGSVVEMGPVLKIVVFVAVVAAVPQPCSHEVVSHLVIVSALTLG